MVILHKTNRSRKGGTGSWPLRSLRCDSHRAIGVIRVTYVELSVLKRSFPKALAFTFFLRLRSKTRRSKMWRFREDSWKMAPHSSESKCHFRVCHLLLCSWGVPFAPKKRNSIERNSIASRGVPRGFSGKCHLFSLIMLFMQPMNKCHFRMCAGGGSQGTPRRS